MIASLEDRVDQSRELGIGADLEKGPRPHAIHRFDLGDELDRPGELAGQQGTGRLGVVGIGLGRSRWRRRESPKRRGRSSRAPRARGASAAATARL